MTTRPTLYSIDAVTGLLYGSAAVSQGLDALQSIEDRALTRPGDRPLRPDYGSLATDFSADRAAVEDSIRLAMAGDDRILEVAISYRGGVMVIDYEVEGIGAITSEIPLGPAHRDGRVHMGIIPAGDGGETIDFATTDLAVGLGPDWDISGVPANGLAYRIYWASPQGYGLRDKRSGVLDISAAIEFVSPIRRDGEQYEIAITKADATVDDSVNGARWTVRFG